MITLSATDTIKGVTTAALTVTYTISGMEQSTASGEVYRVLAQGTLPTSTGTLYTVTTGTITLVKSILMANPFASSLTITLSINSTQIISCVIPGGGSLAYASDGWHLYDGNGDELQGTRLDSTTPTTIHCDDGGIAGTSTSAAHGDHQHAIVTDPPGAIAIGDTVAEGTANSFARSDHRHSVTGGSPGAIAVGDTVADGTATSFARSDHRHSVAAGVPGAIQPDDAAAAGAATTFARSDHKHSIVTDPAGTILPNDAAAEGAATSFARSDHKHGIAVAAPVAIGTGNAAGASSSFARADHVHDHGSQTTTTHHALATTSLAGFMSAAMVQKLGNGVVDVKADFGAKGDNRILQDGAMASGSAILTSASNPFTAADVGKAINVAAAGAAGVQLQTTILSFQSAGQVTLNTTNASGGAISAKTVSYGTDDTTAINNAIASVQTLVGDDIGGIIFFPRGHYRVSAQILVSASGVTLLGVGGGYTADVGNYQQVGGSSIVWAGNNSTTTVVKAAPPVGAGNAAMIGFRFLGLSIDCRNGDQNNGNIALQLLSCHGWHVEDFFIMDPLTAGLDFNVVATLGEARDCTRGLAQRGSIRCLDGPASAATGIRLDGDATANTCFNEFRTIQCMYTGSGANAAVDLLNSDSNVFTNVICNRSSGTVVGIRLNGSNTSVALTARNNNFINCSAGLGGMISRATGLSFPATENIAYSYQTSNGEPLPTVEVGSFLNYTTDGTSSAGASGVSLWGNTPHGRSTANYTNSTVTLTTVTGLSFVMNANEVYQFEFIFNSQCSSTGGTQFGIAAPAGAVVEAGIVATAAALTASIASRLAAINTQSTQVFNTVAAVPAPGIVRGTIVNGATPGTVALQAKSSVAAQVTTVFALASFWAVRTA